MAAFVFTALVVSIIEADIEYDMETAGALVGLAVGVLVGFGVGLTTGEVVGLGVGGSEGANEGSLLPLLCGKDADSSCAWAAARKSSARRAPRMMELMEDNMMELDDVVQSTKYGDDGMVRIVSGLCR